LTYTAKSTGERTPPWRTPVLSWTGFERLWPHFVQSVHGLRCYDNIPPLGARDSIAANAKCHRVGLHACIRCICLVVCCWALSPWLSIGADVALVKNNARVGSIIAASLAAEVKKHQTSIEPVRTAASTAGRQRIDEGARSTSRAAPSCNIVRFYCLLLLTLFFVCMYHQRTTRITRMYIRIITTTTLWVNKKTSHYNIAHNFAKYINLYSPTSGSKSKSNKCWLIFKILSLTASLVNLQQTFY